METTGPEKTLACGGEEMRPLTPSFYRSDAGVVQTGGGRKQILQSATDE